MSDASLLTGRVQTAGRLDRAVAELAAEAGAVISGIEPVTRSLEEAFLELLGEEAP